MDDLRISLLYGRVMKDGNVHLRFLVRLFDACRDVNLSNLDPISNQMVSKKPDRKRKLVSN